MIDLVGPATGATSGPTSITGADAASVRVPATGNVDAGVDFGTMLTQLASHTASALHNAENVSVAGVQGRATVQQVVEAVMSAEQTLQGAVAIRDKVVAAYLEISRMQI